MAKNFNKALDTNEVIALYNISKGIKPKYANQDKDFILSIYHLYDLVENSEFSFYITTEIFSEIQKGVEKYGHDERIFQFIFDIGIQYKPVPEYLQKACSILQQTYLGKNKERSDLEKAFNSSEISDARIMAEATVLGLDIITNNFHHFIGDESDNQHNIKHKILRINNSLGYTQGVPNTTYQFLKKSAPELFDKYGRVKRNPRSLALAPLEKPKPKIKDKKKKHKKSKKLNFKLGNTFYEKPKQKHLKDNNISLNKDTKLLIDSFASIGEFNDDKTK